MQHKVVPPLTLDRVDYLRVAFRTQRRDHKCLCFPSCKHRRPVGSREQSCINRYGPNRLEVSAINSWLSIQNSTADDIFFQCF